MMDEENVFKAKHIQLRIAVAYLLSVVSLENKLCSFERLCKPLAWLAGSDGDDEFIEGINIELLQQAFSKSLGGREHIITAYTEPSLTGEGID